MLLTDSINEKEISWNKNLKGNQLSLKQDQKTVFAMGTAYNSIISEQKFDSGHNLVKLIVNKSIGNVFFGLIGDNEYECINTCPRKNEKVWAIGPKLVFDNSEEKLFNEKYEEIRLFLQEKDLIVEMLLDFQEKKMSFILTNCNGTMKFDFMTLNSYYFYKIIVVTNIEAEITIDKLFRID